MTVVEKQLQYWNRKDLKGFLNCYTDDVKVKMLQTDQILAEGIDNLKEVMKSSFEQGNKSQTTVLSSIEQGNLIVNRERIQNHVKDKVVYSVSIYEITEGKISSLWFGGRTIEDQ